MLVPAASSSVKEEQHQNEKEADRNRKDETLLNVIRPDYERPAPPPPMEPLYQLTDRGKVQGKHCKHFFSNHLRCSTSNFSFCVCVQKPPMKSTLH